MEDLTTDTLRKLAPSWTLAGDERLLTILQNTHQKLLARCQEANSQLEQMATALDDASVSLQNVNNQFMALSSSQFIESRVYDDDTDVSTEKPMVKQESPKPSPQDELSVLKRSIAVIEGAHSVITILRDSDTDTDTDDELTDRLVMKPKDMYADRPLPYIIGSEPWKTKWHAGLMPEDSDSDSTTSKVDRESDQYSPSETEDMDTGNNSKVQDTIPVPQHVRQLSETSSDLPSENTPTSKPTPSDVASEIARRLGAGLPPKMVDPEPVYEEPSRPVVRKVYKPQEPVASTIFPDEPPPLESASDSDADIFAGLDRKQPYTQPYTHQHVTDQLFGHHTDDDDGGDIFSDFANQPQNTKPTSLFDAGPTPHMFDRQTRVAPQANESDVAPKPPNTMAPSDQDERAKKPIGGISLFGSNKGAESIGAAILKRNRRKSSTSGDESGNDAHEPPPPHEQQSKREKDIFDDLFAKSESKNAKPKVDNVIKDIKHQIQKKTEGKEKKDKPKPVDLFSDNLFDDIDDIFTTNIVKSSKDKQKSIFEDDDDLFSEIAAPKTVKPDVKSSNDNKKSLFDSDDDLFSENVTKEKPNVSNKPKLITKVSDKTTKISDTTPKNVEPNKVIKETASIFDDDEDDLFSNIKTNKSNDITKVQNVTKSTVNSNVIKNEITKNVFKSPSLFDDEDDDGGGIFAGSVKPTSINSQDEVVSKVINEMPKKPDQIITEKASVSNVDSTVLSPNTTILKETPNKTEENIDKTHSVDVNTVTQDTISEDNKIVASKNIDHNIVDDIPNTEESFDSNVNEINNDNNLNINTNNTAIERMLDDYNERTSDDDFSEQDFDDETVEEVRTNQNDTSNILEVKEIKQKNAESKDTHDIFDNSALEDDIFASPPPVVDQTDFENIQEPENPKTDSDNKENIANSDIFNTIITEPPAFEKPKEPKRSKNVNALFDDDSDDETLFFKKEDVITDEKPEDFTNPPDRLFDIFTDVPPDVDFNKIDDDLDDLFSTLPKPKIPTERQSHDLDDIPLPDDKPLVNDAVKNKTVDKEINPSPVINKEKPVLEIKDNKDIFKTENKAECLKENDSIFDSNNDIFNQPKSLTSDVINKQISLSDDEEGLFNSLPVHLPKELAPKNQDGYGSDEELFKSLPIIVKSVSPKEEIPKPTNIKNRLSREKYESNSDFTTQKSEPKKVGKLKLGLNINVNALLPGASPKKVKPIDSPDGQTQSNVEIEKDDAKLTKSVSFDGKPESEILDNKLSKERPRIQVKRRPSTRKARREAVRKSGIDFGDDSTDNSSSIDDPPKRNTEDKNINNVTKKIEDKLKNTADNKIAAVNVLDRNIAPQPIDNIIERNATIEHAKPPVKSDSTTKIVYILNDEDIFNTSAIENPEQNKINTSFSKDNIGSKVDANRDLFGSTVDNLDSSVATGHAAKKSEDINFIVDSKPAIRTLGNTYKADEKMSLFGQEEEDDDEIFKNKKPAVKSSIFDSDSEGELFGTGKRVDKRKENDKRKEKVVEVKGSLFGDDDDDDDDLFGIKPKKSAAPQPQSSRSAPATKEPPKSTQPVFNDPLSMFGDDD